MSSRGVARDDTLILFVSFVCVCVVCLCVFTVIKGVNFKLLHSLLMRGILIQHCCYFYVLDIQVMQTLNCQ